jgi:hypothetical protein
VERGLLAIYRDKVLVVFDRHENRAPAVAGALFAWETVAADRVRTSLAFLRSTATSSVIQ